MIYLSNPTRQNWVFNYRTPAKLLAATEIPAGQQVEIGKGWTPEQTEGVVTQMRRAGFRETSEFNGRVNKFLGLLFRIDTPVQSDQIYQANDVVTATQRQRSVDETVKSAAAFDRNANRKSQSGRLARVTQTEVIQELGPHDRPTGDEVAFSMTVDADTGTSNLAMPA